MAAHWTEKAYNQLKAFCQQGLTRKQISVRMHIPYERVCRKIQDSPELLGVCKRDASTRGPYNGMGAALTDKPLPVWGQFRLKPGDEIKSAGSRWRVIEVYDHHFVAEKLTGARYRESFAKRDFMRVGKVTENDKTYT